MAGKFHIKKNGDMGPCRATKACPLGADVPHFDTKEGALKYIEDNEAKNNATFSSLSNSGGVNGGSGNGPVKTTFADADEPNGGDEPNITPDFDDWDNIKEKINTEEGYEYQGDNYTAYLQKNSDGSYYSAVFHHRGYEHDTGAPIVNEDEENFDNIDDAIEKINRTYDMHEHPEDYIDGPNY